MKKEIIGKQQKTTNYPKDSHKAFCERCFKYNGGCPKTKGQSKDHRCNL